VRARATRYRIKSNFDLISFYLFMICVTRFLSFFFASLNVCRNCNGPLAGLSEIHVQYIVMRRITSMFLNDIIKREKCFIVCVGEMTSHTCFIFSNLLSTLLRRADQKQFHVIHLVGLDVLLSSFSLMMNGEKNPKCKSDASSSFKFT
jgi:hypothetical protein